jgi:hypothetical protein
VEVVSHSPVSRSFFSTGPSNMPVKLIEMKSKLATSSSFNSLIIATKKPQKSEPDKQYLYNQQQNFKNKEQFWREMLDLWRRKKWDMPGINVAVPSSTDSSFYFGDGGPLSFVLLLLLLLLFG